jgi:hypothetical protein
VRWGWYKTRQRNYNIKEIIMTYKFQTSIGAQAAKILGRSWAAMREKEMIKRRHLAEVARSHNRMIDYSNHIHIANIMLRDLESCN